MTVAFADEEPVLQRRVTVAVSTAGAQPNGQVITVQLTFGATNGVPAYRGGLNEGWDCDAPAEGQDLAAMTCTHPHTDTAVPPLQFSIEGPNPYVDATVSATDNADPEPGNDRVRAQAPPWSRG